MSETGDDMEDMIENEQDDPSSLAPATFQAMDEQEFCGIIDKAVQAARLFNEVELLDDRVRAMAYYDGDVPDLPPTPNRSKMVSNDLRAVISKLQPAVMRVFFSGQRVADFVGEEEDQQHAVDFIRDEINAQFLRNGGYIAVESALFDALINDEGAIRYSLDGGKLTFEAVPPENILITPDSRSWSDPSLIGHWTKMTRSDLIALGYDEEKVQSASEADKMQTVEDQARLLGNLDVDLGEQVEQVEVIEVFVTIDANGDGIAEIRRVVFMDSCTPETILVNEEVPRIRMFGVRCENRPHSWRGRALARDVMDIQKAKTAIVRAAMDNLAAVNDPLTFVDFNKVVNPDDLLQRKRGAIIQLEANARAEDVLATIQIPLTVDKCFAALDYYDRMLIDRTGISGAASGLMPEVMQGQTATAANMIQAGGTARTELICRNVAESSLKPLFESVFRDVCDALRIPVKLKEASVNVGLGAGSRQNDLGALQIIRSEQDKIVASMGMDNPFVDAEKISNTLDKIVEATGLRTPDAYFNRPTEEQIAAYRQSQQNKPNPEREKLQGQMQLEHAKMQAARDKEEAQAQADVLVKQAEAERDALKARLDADRADADAQTRLAIERMKIESSERIAREKMQHDMAMEQVRQGFVIDPETGTLVRAADPSGQRLDDVLSTMQGLMAALAAPKELVRDETGRAIGVRPVMEAMQ